MMKIVKKYIRESERTWGNIPYEELKNRVLAKKIEIVHAALGMSGEYLEEILGEWKREDIDFKEEYGDVMFYWAAWMRIRDVNVDDFPEDPQLYFTRIERSIGFLAESAKKHLFYDKPLDRAGEIFHLANIFYITRALARIKGMTIEHIMTANLQKLRERYPDGFTKADAIARKDKA
jgi:hypothetical protein